jgi:hypothetical protein
MLYTKLRLGSITAKLNRPIPHLWRFTHQPRRYASFYNVDIAGLTAEQAEVGTCRVMVNVVVSESKSVPNGSF